MAAMMAAPLPAPASPSPGQLWGGLGPELAPLRQGGSFLSWGQQDTEQTRVFPEVPGIPRSGLADGKPHGALLLQPEALGAGRGAEADLQRETPEDGT